MRHPFRHWDSYTQHPLSCSQAPTCRPYLETSHNMTGFHANREVAAVFAAKAARTFAYGYLGILLPLYLADLGLSATGVGAFVTLTLAGSAALTWAVRRPAERLGTRAALVGLAGLSVLSAVLLVLTRDPWLVVLAAMAGNVAVGAGETGPFLSVE